MYKRNVEPIGEFLNSCPPPPGRYCVDCGFGKLYYCSSEVCCTISARTDRNGSTVLVEVLSGGDDMEIETEWDGV